MLHFPLVSCVCVCVCVRVPLSLAHCRSTCVCVSVRASIHLWALQTPGWMLHPAYFCRGTWTLFAVHGVRRLPGCCAVSMRLAKHCTTGCQHRFPVLSCKGHFPRCARIYTTFGEPQNQIIICHIFRDSTQAHHTVSSSRLAAGLQLSWHERGGPQHTAAQSQDVGHSDCLRAICLKLLFFWSRI